jgi:hypothetical protein
MSVWGGTNFVTETPIAVELVVPGVGRIVCPECDGDPEVYSARFGNLRAALAPTGCVDCKNRSWVFICA